MAEHMKVSILMPVFNAQHTLRECVDSVFSQSLQNFEIIAVDDFSSDNSVQLLRSYHDLRIRIIENKNKGIMPALNAGLAHCRSECTQAIFLAAM